MTIRFKSGLSALALAAFAMVTAAEAKEYHFHFDLTGNAETPPNTAPGKGHGTVTYDDKTNDLTWKITWSGLTGDATMAHFHGPAKPGVAAAPVVPLKDDPLVSPLIGSATITPDQAKDLLDGMWYFNVHTAANPKGELRGQLAKDGGKAGKAKPAKS
jgi:hypothetical protein